MAHVNVWLRISARFLSRFPFLGETDDATPVGQRRSGGHQPSSAALQLLGCDQERVERLTKFLCGQPSSQPKRFRAPGCGKGVASWLGTGLSRPGPKQGVGLPVRRLLVRAVSGVMYRLDDPKHLCGSEDA